MSVNACLETPVVEVASRRSMSTTGREFVGMMAGMMALAALSIDLLLPAFADIRAEYGMAADSAQPARLITALFIGMAVGQLIYGPLSDRFGRKPLLYAGLVVYCGAALLAAFMPSFAALVVCRFVWGLGAASVRSLSVAMVRDTFHGEQMAKVMSHVMATFIIVPILAPTVASGALAIAPWRIVFWIPVVGAVAVVVWSMRLPETLPPERRRSISPAALTEALKAVVGTRQTRYFTIALTFMTAIMTSYVAGAETYYSEVFDKESLFPLLFGINACFIGIGSLLSGKVVVRLGLPRLIRLGAIYLLAAGTAVCIVGVSTGGHPPLWAFVVTVALTLPGVTVLVPSCNTASMAPLGHVAGMAAAVLGTVSTGLGAVLGAVVDSSFDGTVRPYSIFVLVFAAIAAVSILRIGRPELSTGRVNVIDEPIAAH